MKRYNEHVDRLFSVWQGTQDLHLSTRDEFYTGTVHNTERSRNGRSTAAVFEGDIEHTWVTTRSGNLRVDKMYVDLDHVPSDGVDNPSALISAMSSVGVKILRPQDSKLLVQNVKFVRRAFILYPLFCENKRKQSFIIVNLQKQSRVHYIRATMV